MTPDSGTSPALSRSARPDWRWLLRSALYALPSIVALVWLATRARDRELAAQSFVMSEYYALGTLLLLAVGLWVARFDVTHAGRWLRSHWLGVAMSALIVTIVLCAVPAKLRVLADEANLVSVSKNMFAHQRTNITVSGSWYYETYWDRQTTMDRRPALFPLLVSLLHAARGYHVENAFWLNALVFAAFLLGSYALAKARGGELFGLGAALLVAASPATLVAVRSAGFDFLATALLLATFITFDAYSRAPSATRLAAFVSTLCLLAHVRYEGWALAALAFALVLALRLFRWSQLAGYGWFYASLPPLLVPRVLQLIAKANDAEQPLSASLFGVRHFSRNLREYFAVLHDPWHASGAHPPLVIVLALLGLALWLYARVRRRAPLLTAEDRRLAWFVAALLCFQCVLTFSYAFGQAQTPISTRLFVWLDAALAFPAAWALTCMGRALHPRVTGFGRRAGAVLTLSLSAFVFAFYLPAASEARFGNGLTFRKASESWRFFASLGEKRILILSDRPGLFTIMDYGSDYLPKPGQRTYLFELSRKQYRDIYLIQDINLRTREPVAGQKSWPDVELQTVHEFQHSDTAFVRISRVVATSGSQQ